MIFTDFRATYGTVLTEKLYLVMERLGIPHKLIKIVRYMIMGLRCKVKSGISDAFTVGAGLCQGDLQPLS